MCSVAMATARRAHRQPVSEFAGKFVTRMEGTTVTYNVRMSRLLIISGLSLFALSLVTLIAVLLLGSPR